MKKKKEGYPASVNRGISLSGSASFQATNVIIGKNSSISHQALTNEDKVEMQRLLNDFEQQLNAVPKSMRDAQAIMEPLAVLKLEAQKASPDESHWELTGKGLVEAAKSVAQMAPSLLKTATAIANFFS
jgi:hypothetical protein